MEMHARLRRFQDIVESFYLNGLPRHISEPKESSIFILTEKEFNKKSIRDVQDILGQKHIIVTDCSFAYLNFDEDGFRTLAPLHRVIEVQGTLFYFNYMDVLRMI